MPNTYFFLKINFNINLMTFLSTLNFIFCGNMQETYTQIGNAVPVILSYKIATSVLESLQKVK